MGANNFAIDRVHNNNLTGLEVYVEDMFIRENDESLVLKAVTGSGDSSHTHTHTP